MSVPVQKVTAMQGRKVQLECNVEGFPRPEISWEFSPERGEEGMIIHTDKRYIKEEFLLSEYTTRTVLTINEFSKKVNTTAEDDSGEVSVQDVGLYVCGARNEMNKEGDKVDGVVYLNMETGKNYLTLDKII